MTSLNQLRNSRWLSFTFSALSLAACASGPPGTITGPGGQGGISIVPARVQEAPGPTNASGMGASSTGVPAGLPAAASAPTR